MDARWAALVLLLVAGNVAAQTQPGPDVVMLVHHPFPDDADILGVPFGEDCSRACDAFAIRHGGNPTFRDGIDFPGFIADGQIAAEALPPGGFAGTFELYDDAVRQRLALETPVTITVGANAVEDAIRVSAWFGTEQDLGDGLVAWAAIVEDPVHYAPPPGLSNGVTEHPFTVRLVERLGPMDIPAGTEQRIDTSLPRDAEWDLQRTRLAIWLEQDRGALGTFEPGEVVQAASHPILSSTLTRQTERAVLIEAYSASWCDPCLIGDAALEALAEAHGLPTGRALGDERSYLQPTPIAWPIVGILAVAIGVVVAGGRLGGEQ